MRGSRVLFPVILKCVSCAYESACKVVYYELLGNNTDIVLCDSSV
jgi:hypothetical protein